MTMPVAELLASLIDTAADLRAVRCSGLPVVDKSAADAAAQFRAQLAPLAKLHRLAGEARAVALLDTMLRCRMSPVADVVAEDVAAIRGELLVGGRGRVDRAVEHHSGAMSLIEVKDSGIQRDIVGGIGQALFYKAILERTTSWAPIIPMLAVLHDHDDDVARACELAGVTYLPLGTVGFWRAASRLVDFSLGNEVAR